MTELRIDCSFCGKAHTDVVTMVAGPSNVFICNECVSLCQEIVFSNQVKQAVKDVLASLGRDTDKSAAPAALEPAP